MALSRRSGQRFQASIWPGFVDAMTGLLLVLMFVLTIFMVVQFVLRETISGQEEELGALGDEIAALSSALGLEEQRSLSLTSQIGTLTASLSAARQTAQEQAAALSAARADALSLEQQVAGLIADRDTAEQRIVALSAQLEGQEQALDAAEARIVVLDGEVAASEEARALAEGEVLRLGEVNAELLTEQEAMALALAQARDEIDSETEAARLAAAQREAIEAMLAEMEAERDGALAQLSEIETAKLADAAAVEALQERLANADAELTAMSLQLERERKDAEDTLTLMAGAEAARDDALVKLASALLAQEAAEAALGSVAASREAVQRVAELEAQVAALTEAQSGADLESALAEALSRADTAEANAAGLSEKLAAAVLAQTELEARVGAIDGEGDLAGQLAAALAAQVAAESARTAALDRAETQRLLLAQAQEALSEEEALSAESQRQVQALNAQVAELRAQLGGLQSALDASELSDAEKDIELSNLGSRLNAALAQVAQEQRARARLEEAERARLEAERDRLAQDLERYKSDFFGELSQVLDGAEGVRVVGDRFVFSSEVLFEPGSARLAPAGQVQVERIGRTLLDVSQRIPDGIDWILRVDGHTDAIPVSSRGPFEDNWELSQARALSVVRFMTERLGFPPERLAANGFGEFRPIAEGTSPEALAQNRRIELKLTER